MPDRNFEQQARDMANGFEMKPMPEVWQNVRNAIQEPRRKRRFVLWWWLLPLGLLGGSFVFYILYTNSELMRVKKAVPTLQKASETATQLKPQTNAEQEVEKEDKSL